METRLLRSGCQNSHVLVRALSQVSKCQLLSVSLPGRSGNQALRGHFYKGTNFSHEGRVLKGLAPIPTPWALGFQRMKFNT